MATFVGVRIGVSNDILSVRPSSRPQVSTRLSRRLHLVAAWTRLPQDFFAWHNDAHHHSGLALFTPAEVFYGRVPTVAPTRQATLDAAYQAQDKRTAAHAGWLAHPIEATSPRWRRALRATLRRQRSMAPLKPLRRRTSVAARSVASLCRRRSTAPQRLETTWKARLLSLKALEKQLGT